MKVYFTNLGEVKPILALTERDLLTAFDEQFFGMVRKPTELAPFEVPNFPRGKKKKGKKASKNGEDDEDEDDDEDEEGEGDDC